MKANSIPPLKKIPGIPRNFGEHLEAMEDEELESMASDCTDHEVISLRELTMEQLYAIVHDTPEGQRLAQQIQAGQCPLAN